MQINLDDQQLVLLREILDRTLRDLSHEIADTDNSRYRDTLRERQSMLRGLLAQVGGPVPEDA